MVFMDVFSPEWSTMSRTWVGLNYTRTISHQCDKKQSVSAVFRYKFYLLPQAVAIPILCSKEMNRFIFNRLLVVLAVFDNFFIVCSVLEGIR